MVERRAWGEDLRSPRAALDAAFRAEGGRILAGLIRILGDFELAEDSLQEALIAALPAWESGGVPRNPAAWLTTTARRRAIDRLRRRRPELPLHDLGELAESNPPESPAADDPFPDDRLRLLFTCCHPALALEARVALTLRTLGGLSTGEIARAFLLPEATLAQRLVRAKRKIRAAGIPYRIPPRPLLPERLEGVLAVLYLIFNEGYAASQGDAVTREDLCCEAIRLGRALRDLLPDEPEPTGLLALMLLQHSRRDARVSSSGAPVLLEQQDRSRWDQQAIREGTALVRQALQQGRPGPYQIQAAVAALHAEAATPEDTDWRQIAGLYAHLVRLQDSPVVRLNHAVAAGMAFGPIAGLALMDAAAVAGPLADYRWLHSARGELLRRLGRPDEAREALNRALALTSNHAERTLLESRLDLLPHHPTRSAFPAKPETPARRREPNPR